MINMYGQNLLFLTHEAIIKSEKSEFTVSEIIADVIAKNDFYFREKREKILFRQRIYRALKKLNQLGKIVLIERKTALNTKYFIIKKNSYGKN